MKTKENSIALKLALWLASTITTIVLTVLATITISPPKDEIFSAIRPLDTAKSFRIGLAKKSLCLAGERGGVNPTDANCSEFSIEPVDAGKQIYRLGVDKFSWCYKIDTASGSATEAQLVTEKTCGEGVGREFVIRRQELFDDVFKISIPTLQACVKIEPIAPHNIVAGKCDEAAEFVITSI